MSEDQFTKLFKYMQEGFAGIRSELEDFKTETDVKIDRLVGLMDAHEKRMETLEQEHLMVCRNLELHEGWIEKAARVVKIEYQR